MNKILDLVFQNLKHRGNFVLEAWQVEDMLADKIVLAWGFKHSRRYVSHIVPTSLHDSLIDMEEKTAMYLADALLKELMIEKPKTRLGRWLWEKIARHL